MMTCSKTNRSSACSLTRCAVSGHLLVEGVLRSDCGAGVPGVQRQGRQVVQQWQLQRAQAQLRPSRQLPAVPTCFTTRHALQDLKQDLNSAAATPCIPADDDAAAGWIMLGSGCACSQAPQTIASTTKLSYVESRAAPCTLDAVADVIRARPGLQGHALQRVAVHGPVRRWPLHTSTCHVPVQALHAPWTPLLQLTAAITSDAERESSYAGCINGSTMCVRMVGLSHCRCT